MGRDWRFGAPRGKLQHGLDLLPGDSKFLNELIDAHVLKVLEYRRNWRARSTKYNGATPLAGNALDGGALRPIDASHTETSFYIL